MVAPKLFLKLDDVFDRSVADSSGQQKVAFCTDILPATTTVTGGTFTGCVTLNGTTSAIDVSLVGGASGTDFTLAAWVRKTSTNTNAGVEPLISVDFGPSLELNNGIPRLANGATAASALVKDSWTHIAVTNSNGTTKLYVDGISAGSASNYGSSGIAGNVSIGKSTTRAFTGQMAQVAIFDVALHADAIVRLRKKGRLFSPTLHLPLNCIVNDKFLDISGNGRHATAYNMKTTTWWENMSEYKIADFNGTSGRLLIPNLPVTSNFTFATWLMPRSTSSMRGAIFTSETGYPSIYLDYSNYSWYCSSASAENGNNVIYDWSHLVVTQDATNVKMYVDGSLGLTSTNRITPTTGNYCIGANSSTGASYYRGYMRDVMLFDEALPLEMINLLR